MTIGYVFKAEYFLPENASNYLNIVADPFDITPQPITGRRKKRDAIDNSVVGFDNDTKQKYEKYEVRPELIESKTDVPEEDEYESNEQGDYGAGSAEWANSQMGPREPQNFGTSRWTLYKGLELLAQK